MDHHLSDERLLRYGDAELDDVDKKDVISHIAACARCRIRFTELESVMERFRRTYRDQCQFPPTSEVARSLLIARLRQGGAPTTPATPIPRFRHFPRVWAVGLVAAAILVVMVRSLPSPSERQATPRADLTPGAVRSVSVSELCGSRLGDNAEVVPALQHAVFAEYGMASADSGGYEVDYLITPALGGSDDIRNLWPQPYGGSPWNAYVKDALENRLRGMVCSGQMDLAKAQNEIAGNWIAAYKKYFHTHLPLARHQRVSGSRTETE